MSFDKNHESPDKIVEPRRRTTQVNLMMVLAIMLFFVVMGIVVWRVVRNPPQNPADASTLQNNPDRR